MQPVANFDRVARIYRFCEYLALGRLLERVRFARMRELADARRALVLGDGDGRFLERLVVSNPSVNVVAVDASTAMLRLAEERVRRAGAHRRVQFVHADVRGYAPEGGFDAVTTHFVLDCFPTAELDGFLPRLAGCVAPGGVWVHSEFRLPRSPLRPLAWAYTRALYVPFRVLAGVGTDRLPDDAGALARAGLHLEDTRQWLGGMLVSEFWRMPRS